MPIKTTIENIKIMLANWRNKLNKRRIAIFLLAILILFGLSWAVTEFKKVKKEKGIAPLPSPSPTPIEEEITAPSAYATDSAVLAIEEDLKTLEKDLLETDLYETGLNPPVLDMKVEFKE